MDDHRIGHREVPRNRIRLTGQLVHSLTKSGFVPHLYHAKTDRPPGALNWGVGSNVHNVRIIDPSVTLNLGRGKLPRSVHLRFLRVRVTESPVGPQIATARLWCSSLFFPMPIWLADHDSICLRSSPSYLEHGWSLLATVRPESLNRFG